MPIIEPPECSAVADREEIQTDVMDYPLEVIYEDKNYHVTTIHIRTIPPGLSLSNEDYWMDVINQYNEVRAFECRDLWYSIHMSTEDFDVTRDIAEYAAEAYYNIYNHKA